MMFTICMWHEGDWIKCDVAGYARAVGLFTTLMLSFDSLELREDGKLLSTFKDGRVFLN